MSNDKTSLEYAGIRFSGRELCGVQGGRVYSVIPHSEVRRITLHRGSGSAHPIIQLLVGALLATTGIPVIMHLIYWTQHGGTIVSAEALFLTFPSIGIIMLLSAFRRSFYLRVEKQRGRTKLAFDSSAQLENIRALLASAQPLATYPIEVDPQVARSFN